MVRVVRLERTVSWSQTRRDTNFAIPGYSISAIIPRRERKSKIFLSVVIPVVKADFIPFSAIEKNPANAGAARLCGVSPHPIPDTATALPKQARYQLRYTRIYTFLRGCGRVHTFNISAIGIYRRSLPRPCSAFPLCSRARFLTARPAAKLHISNLRKTKFNTFFRNSQRFSALQFRGGCGMLYK